MQNDNIDQPATQPEPSQNLKGLKGKLKATFTRKSIWGFAKAAFNNARKNKWEILGSGLVSFGIKWGALACTVTVASSAIGMISLAATAGAASALTRHGIKIALAKKGEERDALRISNKELLKKVALGATFGAAGSAFGQLLAVGYGHLNHECFSRLSTAKNMFITANKPDAVLGIGGHLTKPDVSLLQTTPPVAETMAHVPAPVSTPDATAMAPTAPATAAVTDVPAVPSAPAQPLPHPQSAVIIAPAPEPSSPLDAIKDYAAHNKISARLKDALSRAESPSARVRAQALDDIGVFAPKDLQVQAYELLKQSASMGNLKAQTDIITMEFQGNKALGIKANPEAAIDKMVELAKHSKRAAKLVKEWVGDPSGPVAPAAPVSLPHHTIPTSPVPKMVDVTNTPIAQAPVAAPAHVIPVSPAPIMVDVSDIELTQPVAPSVPNAQPECLVAVDPENIENLILRCKGGGDMGLNIGDEVVVKRPALWGPMVR